MRKIGNKRALPVTDEQIVEAYRTEASVYVVSRALGVSPTTIYRVLQRSGVEREGLAKYRETAAAFDAEMSAKIRDEHEVGASFSDLIDRYGGTIYSIKSAIRRAGGTPREIAPPERKGEFEKIRDMYESGMSQMKISLAIGRSQSFVTRILRKHGIEQRKRAGAAHGMWKGGRSIDGNGYVRVSLASDDPFAEMRNKDGQLFEHRLVLARKLGRPLLRSETVHHVNGDRTDNRPENLQLRQGRHGKHVVMCCLDCGSRRLGPVEI